MAHCSALYALFCAISHYFLLFAIIIIIFLFTRIICAGVEAVHCPGGTAGDIGLYERHQRVEKRRQCLLFSLFVYAAFF
jgi:hypothetical protein